MKRRIDETICDQCGTTKQEPTTYPHIGGGTPPGWLHVFGIYPTADDLYKSTELDFCTPACISAFFGALARPS